MIPSLLEILSDVQAHDHAIEVLQALLTDETLPAFLKHLSSESAPIVGGVTEVLSSSKTYDAARLLDHLGVSGPARSHVETILHSQIERVPTDRLVSAFSSAGKETRSVLCRLLDSVTTPTLAPRLLPLLDEEDWWLRLHTLRLLTRFPSEQVTRGAILLLKDPHKGVRLQAAQSLGEMNARDAIAELCGALRDPDLKVHTAAIDALVKVADASAVMHLLEVLKDESEYARRGAVEVLNEVATTDAVKDLVNALRDEDWWVRSRAADALGQLGGKRVVDAVLSLLASDDASVRRYAVEILIAVPDERAVEPLITALQDPDWWVRERSIDALATIGDRRAVVPLIQLMGADPQAAPLCARALGALDDERAVEALLVASDSENEELRKRAKESLSTLQKGKLSAENSERIRSHRPNAIGPLPIPSAAPESEIVDPTRADIEAITPATPPLNYQDLRPGDVLGNRFEVIRKVGGGGFGTVYLVNDTAVKEELILKVLRPHISMDETMIKRFVHELKYSRRITHRNIIRIYDLLELEGGHAISMEYFPGTNLARIIKDAGRMDPVRGLRLVVQIASGLAAAHAEGVVHRDIKPPNILVGDDDVAKIVDFGLASMAQDAGSRLTKSGILIGTPHYMAPEQIKGEEVDARTDIYSLGIMMYELFSGQPPFLGENAVNILFQHINSEAPTLSEVIAGFPHEVSRLVAWAMAKRCEDRPPDVPTFLQSIEGMAA